MLGGLFISAELGGVVGVNAYVPVGEVASPHCCGARTVIERYMNENIAALHVFT